MDLILKTMNQVKMKEIKSNNHPKYRQVLIMKILGTTIQWKDQYVQSKTWLFHQEEEPYQLTQPPTKRRSNMIYQKTKR
jgi:hypothetical protein